jgi:hypothetical protein
MEFISKYDTSFIRIINKKYSKHFKCFDEYSLYLFELTHNEKEYYYQLEEDIKEYSDFQTERKYNNGKQERKNTQ